VLRFAVIFPEFKISQNICFSDNLLDDFMLKVKNEKAVSTYRDYLCTMKVFYRDYMKEPEVIEDYKFSTKPFKPKILPTKAELKIFYDALGDKT